ncbi:hypothetical protein AEGHOMDF_5152 [Methylobacterium soli]|nr:hypothetical protein AEGHOMDF_5152 [Methylobacterium soli]
MRSLRGQAAGIDRRQDGVPARGLGRANERDREVGQSEGALVGIRPAAGGLAAETRGAVAPQCLKLGRGDDVLGHGSEAVPVAQVPDIVPEPVRIRIAPEHDPVEQGQFREGPALGRADRVGEADPDARVQVLDHPVARRDGAQTERVGLARPDAQSIEIRLPVRGLVDDLQGEVVVLDPPVAERQLGDAKRDRHSGRKHRALAVGRVGPEHLVEAGRVEIREVPQEFRHLEGRAQAGVRARRAHVGVARPDPERGQFLVEHVDVAARDEHPDPHVEILIVRQARIVGADLLVGVAPDHGGRCAQAIAVEKEVPEPAAPREVGQAQGGVEVVEGHGRRAALVDGKRHSEHRRNVGIGIQEGDLGREAAGQGPVVGVEDREIAPAGAGDRGVHRPRDAAVCGQHLEAQARIVEAAQDRGGRVGRGIVGDDDLEILERLVEDAPDRLRHVGRVVVALHQNRHGRG